MSDAVHTPPFPRVIEVGEGQHGAADSCRTRQSQFPVNEAVPQSIFGKHPYSFLVPDEKSIAALTREDLKGFVSSYMRLTMRT